MTPRDHVREYAGAGFALVALNGKSPRASNWNQRENCYSKDNPIAVPVGNVGLAHAFSTPPTCAVDIDDLKQSRAWLAARGIDLDALLDAADAVQIASGRENRAKLIYHLPSPMTSKKVVHDRQSVLDFRCATTDGLTAQDVLPPSIHPNTGKPYRWEVGPVGDELDPPMIPQELLAVWQELLVPSREVVELKVPRGLALEDIREKLEPLDPDMSRDEWVHVAMAVHHETGGSKEGRQLFDDWSKRGSKYQGARDIASVWRSIRGGAADPITIDTLDRMRPPSADCFDGVPAEAGAVPLRRMGKGVPIPDEENVRLIVGMDPELAGAVQWDAFRDDLMLRHPLPIPGEGRVVADAGVPRLYRDEDTTTLQTYIQRKWIPKIGSDKVYQAVRWHARNRATFHPIREYLDGLRWDGKARIDGMLANYFRAASDHPQLLTAFGSKFLLSAVARVMRPGCKVDTAIVLEGAQGCGKSTALRILAGEEYFSDSLPADLSHKDAQAHLSGKWIIELSELAQLRRRDVETIKSFLSRSTERFRPPYGRAEVEAPRQCVFAGTTNEAEYLVDQSGNRRFWPVSVGLIDLEGLARDRDQLWAEAFVRFKAGEEWHLTGEDARIAATETEARVAVDPWSELVANVTHGETEVAPGEVLGLMGIQPDQRNPNAAKRVGAVLSSQGWGRGPRHKSRGQLFQRAA